LNNTFIIREIFIFNSESSHDREAKQMCHRRDLEEIQEKQAIFAE
jgi:hypothetical protein